MKFKSASVDKFYWNRTMPFTYTLPMAAFVLQHGWVELVGTVCPAKLEEFTDLSFVGNSYQSLIYTKLLYLCSKYQKPREKHILNPPRLVNIIGCISKDNYPQLNKYLENKNRNLNKTKSHYIICGVRDILVSSCRPSDELSLTFFILNLEYFTYFILCWGLILRFCTC
jgi:hypothetical protein